MPTYIYLSNNNNTIKGEDLIIEANIDWGRGVFYGILNEEGMLTKGMSPYDGEPFNGNVPVKLRGTMHDGNIWAFDHCSIKNINKNRMRFIQFWGPGATGEYYDETLGWQPYAQQVASPSDVENIIFLAAGSLH
jgi:hypothetical protein